jgi:isopenicillin N synthase-like dioxygenase
MRKTAISEIGRACMQHGFFYIVGHGVPQDLIDRLHDSSINFFDLPIDIKRRISMDKGGKAWRGYFGVGEELTR